MTDLIIAKLNEHDEEFTKIHATQDRMIEKIVQLDADVQEMKEKMVKLDLIDDLLAGQDKMVRILERMDQERTFTNTRIDRHEERIVRLEQHPALV